MASSPPLSLTRSPSSSSITYCSSGRSSLDYPSPPVLVDQQQYKLPSVYGSGQRCSLTPPMDSHSSLPPFDALCQPEWAGSTLLHPSSSGSAMPSILSSDYDSYPGYDVAAAPPYGHDMYETHQPHSDNGHGSTPPPLGTASRSRGPSSRTSASYPSAGPISGSLPPRIKLEDAGDYGHGVEVSQYPSPGSMHAAYATDSASYAGSTSGYLSDGPSSWRAPDYQERASESESYYDSAADNAGFMQDGKRPYRVTRPRRAPRRLTTREEANFQCEVKGCGKLFSRSYNFKAHMETHDEKREYPFPCLADDCNKKFVRKTDLQRHHQSVHMKERNHKCDFCGRLFARKDTLRRHMEDGCSKRFDIGTLDLRSENYDETNSSARQLGVSPLNLLGPPPGGLPPMSIAPLASNGGLFTSPTPPMPSRDQATDRNPGHPWGH